MSTVPSTAQKERHAEYEAYITSKGWKWSGMRYRDNGDGYGVFQNIEARNKARIGAYEAGWDPKKETYKAACFRAFANRLKALEQETMKDITAS